MAGLHHHKCECGNIWEHEQQVGGSQEVYTAAHTCTQCGADVREAHFKTPEAEREWKEIRAAHDPFYAILLAVFGDQA